MVKRTPADERAEEVLRRSEKHLAKAQQIAHIGSWELDLHDLEDLSSNELRWSDETYRIFGYRPREVPVTNDLFFQAVHVEDRPRIVEAVGRALRDRKPYQIEHRILRRDGAERIIYEHADVVCDDKTGRLLMLLGTCQDITERRHVEIAARENAERFHLLVDGVKDYAIYMLDADGRVVSWNAGAERIMGYAADEVLNQPDDAFFTCEDVKRGLPKSVLRTADQKGHCETEGWRVRKNGEHFRAHAVIRAMRAPDGRLRGFAKVVRDVTDIRRLEQAILEIGAEERRRIGQDLHDGLGQHLTGTALLSKALQRRLAKKSKALARDAGTLAQMASQAVAAARDIVKGVDPVGQASGLQEALEALASDVSSYSRINCRLEQRKAVAVRNPTAAVHLYRIAQEAVTNAVRHGRARNIVLSLSRREKQIHLRIHDDGRGFASPAPHGRGLKSMEYRARVLGGVLRIESSEGSGSTVSCDCSDEWSKATAQRAG